MNYDKLLKNFTFSYFAFSIAEACTHPLFVIRNNYLSNTEVSIPTHAKLLYENSGIRGFYKSALPIYLRQGISISLKYSLYTSLQEYYDKSNFFYNILNGLMVCNIAAIIEHPIDVIAFNKSIDVKTNVNDAYKGFLANITKQSVGAMVLPLYQKSYDYCNKHLDNNINILVSSVFVATVLTVLNYPFDYFRMNKIRTNSYDFKNNFRNVYCGSSLSFLRNSIHLFVFMNIIDYLKKNDTPFFKKK